MTEKSGGWTSETSGIASKHLSNWRSLGGVGILGIISLIFGLNIDILHIDFLKIDICHIHVLKPSFVYFLIGM